MPDEIQDLPTIKNTPNVRVPKPYLQGLHDQRDRAESRAISAEVQLSRAQGELTTTQTRLDQAHAQIATLERRCENLEGTIMQMGHMLAMEGDNVRSGIKVLTSEEYLKLKEAAHA